MIRRVSLISAAPLLGAVLLAVPMPAAAQSTQSPYGGVPVEEIVARVNDQIITLSDYNRAVKEADDEARQHGATTMQEISQAHRDVLRDLIDQQLWLSKGKELGINEDTELVKKLDDIRKQYHMDSIDDLQKAAQEQGISFEDFKASIRNSLITQEVMREEVGEKITMTPGEVERYYEAHKDQYTQPESERLSEILVSAGTPAAGASEVDDPAKLAAAKAKADDIEAKLHAGGDFAQLARSFSDGPTAAQGGDLGQYQRGQLPKALEDDTFQLKGGEFTDPIRTRQGYVILKVVEHTPGGPAPYADVKDQVEDAYFMSRMEPKVRDYLATMRDQSYIDIRPGYTDTAASPNETKPVFSAYAPPAPKKKRKLIRTRFRESTHSFRQKGGAQLEPAVATKGSNGQPQPTNEKPGKKEKIRYGQAPRETLPASATDTTKVEDAGALPETASNASTDDAISPLETAPAKPEVKTRFSQRARQVKVKKESAKKARAKQDDALTPAPADASEVADRQTQSAPLGLGGNTAPTKKKKKKATTTSGDKTRLSDEKKKQEEEKKDQEQAPVAQTPEAPAPAGPQQ